MSRSDWYRLDCSVAENIDTAVKNGESISLPVFAQWANTSSNFTAGS